MKTQFVDPTTTKTFIPVVLSDSKGGRLKSVVTNRVEQNIVWWNKSGDTIQNRIIWLRENLHHKKRLLGNIHLYVWLGTCNITSRVKSGFISLSPNPADTVDFIIDKYREIIDILAVYPDSKVSILEVPVYSIVTYNTKLGHSNPSKFTNQDTDLINAVLDLNHKIGQINRQLGTRSPNFNRNLYSNTKHRSQDRSHLDTRIAYNLNLYTDGIHPSPLLARVWLRKLAQQMKFECWMQ